MNPSLNYNLRYMVLDDVPQVIQIDEWSFPMPWSSRSYLFEITDNKSSHMVVLDAHPVLPNGVRGLFQRLSRRPRQSPLITGYGGFWYIDGEAHISTIAVHPEYRSQGLGEVLLSGMLARSIDLNAEYAVLEVRVSNEHAIKLYKKYEFEIVGQRKGYYRDNNEDAYLMHCSPLDAAYRARFADRLTALKTRVNFKNLLST